MNKEVLNRKLGKYFLGDLLSLRSYVALGNIFLEQADVLVKNLNELEENPIKKHPWEEKKIMNPYVLLFANKYLELPIPKGEWRRDNLNKIISQDMIDEIKGNLLNSATYGDLFSLNIQNHPRWVGRKVTRNINDSLKRLGIDYVIPQRTANNDG